MEAAAEVVTAALVAVLVATAVAATRTGTTALMTIAATARARYNFLVLWASPKSLVGLASLALKSSRTIHKYNGC